MHVMTNEVTGSVSLKILFGNGIDLLDILNGSDWEFSENTSFDGPSYLVQSTVGLKVCSTMLFRW